MTQNRAMRRRLFGKNKSRQFDNAISAEQWVQAISNIKDDNDLKSFQEMVNRQHPNNIPMTTIKQALTAKGVIVNNK